MKEMSRRKQLGDYFIGEDGEVWKLISYCPTPSVTFRRERDGQQRGGAEGSLVDQEFKHLVFEGPTAGEDGGK